MIIVPLNNYQIIGMVNVEKIANTFLFPVGDQGWSSQNAYQKSKQESPWSDFFFRSSLILVCIVCLGLFDRQ